MAKKFFGLIFILTSVLAWSAPKDFIVVMELSDNMFDSYGQVVKSYFPEIVKDHLRQHDFFHLITFSGNPELQLSQRIDTENDVEVVLHRLFLLQPLAKHVDTVLALRFVYQYALSLPAYENKTIVMFLSGLYRPEPNSVLTKSQAQTELESLIQQIKSKGWNLKLITVGDSGNQGAKEIHDKNLINLDIDKVAQKEDVSIFKFSPQIGFSNLTLGIPRITFPNELGTIAQSFSLPLNIHNTSNSSVLLHIKKVNYNGEDLLVSDLPITLGPNENKSFSIPLTFVHNPTDGPQTGTFQLIFDDEIGAYPNEAQIRFNFHPSWSGWLIPLLIVVGLFIGGSLVYLIIKLVRRGYEQGKVLADQHVTDRTETRAKKVEPASKQETFVRPTTSQKLGISPTEKPSAKPAPKSAKVDKFSVNGEPQMNQAVNAVVPDEGGSLKKEDSFAMLGPSKEKIGDELAVSRKDVQRYDDFKNPKVRIDFSSFLKRPDKDEFPAKASVVELPSVTVFSNKSKPVGAQKDFSMLVWTQDFIFQNSQKSANLFRLRPGDKKSVGNGRSHFKILLASVKDVIAEVFYDGENLIFHPVIRTYFPTLESDIASCAGKDIPVQVGSEKTLFLRFFPHVSKTEEMNKILRGNAPTLDNT